MKKNSMKKVISSLLCMAMLLGCGLTTMAAESNADTNEMQYKITAEDLGVVAPKTVNSSDATLIEMDEISSLALDNSPTQRNQIGEPMDQMYFYYMQLYPIAQDPSTGQLYALNIYASKSTDKRANLYQAYTAAETTALYNEVIKLGYNMVGWQTKVKFRFDFILAHSWTLSIDGGQSVTDNCPTPHNAYQTYIYTYNSFFQTDPLQTYDTSFKGSVYYMDKYDGNRGKDRPFLAKTAFNVPQ